MSLIKDIFFISFFLQNFETNIEKQLFSIDHNKKCCLSIKSAY